MKSKPLIETNPYLKDPAVRDEFIKRSVETSCGVEGIKAAAGSKPSIKIPERKEMTSYRRKIFK